jgi:hypothetical protein
MSPGIQPAPNFRKETSIMSSFITCNDRPKCIVSFTMRIPEETDTYLEEHKGKGSKADLAKALLEEGMKHRVVSSMNVFNLIPLQKFFTQNSCKTMIVTILPTSDPQARFLHNQGNCEE